MNPHGRLCIERVASGLPAAFGGLQADARHEGVRFVDRLADEWATGVNRFCHEGEMLLAAWHDGALVGIGGLTQEPEWPGALRMRRFYVRPAWRRIGVGRRLAEALLATVPPAQGVTVNAATVLALAFWQALGFVACQRGGYTHVLERPAMPG